MHVNSVACFQPVNVARLSGRYRLSLIYGQMDRQNCVWEQSREGQRQYDDRAEADHSIGIPSRRNIYMVLGSLGSV